MAHLTLETAGEAEPREIELFKSITTIGSSEECDVYVSDDPKVAATHATILFDGHTWRIQSAARWHALFVNGQRKKSTTLSHLDVVRLGDTELTLLLEDATPPGAARAPLHDGTVEQVNAYRKVYEFSERLLGNYDLDSLLSDLLDTVINVTGADTGFLIICDEDQLRVPAARTAGRQDIEYPEAMLSDSIVQRTVRERRPIIISDALADEQWNASLSVIQLKLCSVMCVPLLDRGTLLGVLYVGNDNVVDMFAGADLEVLTIFAAQASLILRNALLVNELKLDVARLKGALDRQRFGELIGACDSIRDVFKRVEKVASADIGVLITGETGTGKELIAREVHVRSSRVDGPFVTINCGAIPENLLESELFGHVRGAFTGATATHEGKFHAAHHGTLFLDEIGEMPLNLQVKILRALQDRMVTRVGDTKAVAVDIRVVAATNKNLAEAIRAGQFREDLYYRLNVVTVDLPPLRDRGDDILLLARYFLERYAADFVRNIKGFSANAVAAMRRYHWPGNIRELENKVKRAVILTDTALISPKDLELSEDSLRPVLPLAEAKEEFQRRYVNEVLARNNGNRTQTAKDLGVDPRTVFRHLEKEAQRRDGEDRALPAWTEDV